MFYFHSGKKLSKFTNLQDRFCVLLFGIFLDFIWYLWFIPSLASFTIHIYGSKLNLLSPTYKLVNWFIYGLINSDFVMFLLRFLTF